ncbi:hypothetical protein C0Q70_20924 [Pomacea canaliculata]|uniref:Uncharacterized protein n=1 Tax=Pomacea canaliculata TaxID=400727 RepID=A0A2T7NB30_POMCA|nr:hypothetical protein C0Q70_20924 [Pomacea canaliculata]
MMLATTGRKRGDREREKNHLDGVTAAFSSPGPGVGLTGLHSPQLSQEILFFTILARKERHEILDIFISCTLRSSLYIRARERSANDPAVRQHTWQGGYRPPLAHFHFHREESADRIWSRHAARNTRVPPATLPATTSTLPRRRPWQVIIQGAATSLESTARGTCVLLVHDSRVILDTQTHKQACRRKSSTYR